MDSTTLSSLALIFAAALLAPLLSEATRRLRLPIVVFELLLGVLIGPYVLGWAEASEVVKTLSDIGLAFLMFLAGYDLDLDRVRGEPLRLATAGWALSAVVAFGTAFVLVETGFVLSALLVGLALTTTALGTLLPMLRDSGDLETKFGSYVLAIGAAGEFLPVVGIALLLTTDNPGGTAVLLVGFVLLAAAAAAIALRPKPPRVVEVLGRGLHSSAQLPIRLAVLLVIGLVWVASELGLDVLLGAFAAGLIVRLGNSGREQKIVSEKLEAIGFGFLIPIFFIVSGMNFDVEALASPSAIWRVPVFLALFWVARGVPVLFLYRKAVPGRDRAALSLFASTALPLVVVITGIGTATGRMHPENATALVGAAMLSVILFPTIGFGLRKRRSPEPASDSTLPMAEEGT